MSRSGGHISTRCAIHVVDVNNGEVIRQPKKHLRQNLFETESHNVFWSWASIYIENKVFLLQTTTSQIWCPLSKFSKAEANKVKRWAGQRDVTASHERGFQYVGF